MNDTVETGRALWSLLKGGMAGMNYLDELTCFIGDFLRREGYPESASLVEQLAMEMQDHYSEHLALISTVLDTNIGELVGGIQ